MTGLVFRGQVTLTRGSPEAASGRQLRNNYEARQRQADRKRAEVQASLESSMRVSLARAFENQMLDAGYNMDVTADGPRHTVLRLKYVLANKVLAYKLTNMPEMRSSAKEAGFKSVVLTDGYDLSWTWKID